MTMVTRVARSKNLNAGKYQQLAEQAKRLGRVRTMVWDQYGSLAGVPVGYREVLALWKEERIAPTFGVLTAPCHDTIRDAMGDIKANRESAKEKVRRNIRRLKVSDARRKELYTALKRDEWMNDPWLHRQMRKHCVRGRNHTHNQIVVRPQGYSSWVVKNQTWIAVTGLESGKRVKIPLNTNREPTGQIRLILKAAGVVEVHYCVAEAELKSSAREVGDRTIGVDKGYTEVFVDSDGDTYGEGFGDLLRAESDRRNQLNRRRSKLRSVAKKAAESGDWAKHDRIVRHNLGVAKRQRRQAIFEAQCRSLVYSAAHAVLDKAGHVVSEDLTWSSSKKGPLVQRSGSKRSRGRVSNRRLNAWQKGLIAEAVDATTRRRGSTHSLVNSAYTSQVDPRYGTLNTRRSWGKLYCSDGVVYEDDYAAALNVLARLTDPDIRRYMPRAEVEAILNARTERHRRGLAPSGL